jgi:hypothetical protein
MTPADPKMFRAPSDISDARARRAARLVALAKRRRLPLDQVRAMAIELSRQLDITVDQAIIVLDMPRQDDTAPRARPRS